MPCERRLRGHVRDKMIHNLARWGELCLKENYQFRSQLHLLVPCFVVPAQIFCFVNSKRCRLWATGKITMPTNKVHFTPVRDECREAQPVFRTSANNYIRKLGGADTKCLLIFEKAVRCIFSCLFLYCYFLSDENTAVYVEYPAVYTTTMLSPKTPNLKIALSSPLAARLLTLCSDSMSTTVTSLVSSAYASDELDKSSCVIGAPDSPLTVVCAGGAVARSYFSISPFSLPIVRVFPSRWVGRSQKISARCRRW